MSEEKKFKWYHFVFIVLGLAAFAVIKESDKLFPQTDDVGAEASAPFSSDASTNSKEPSSQKEEIEDINAYITGRTFNLNGNGSVSFSPGFSDGEGTIMINGNGHGLLGKYHTISSRSIRIEDLQVVSGEFDASNNNGSSGIFTLTYNGKLAGTLTGGGTSRTYTFSPNN